MAKTLRCAIYTRKSSEEGLEQDFNSLHAQREACEAFIKSQKHEGWQLIKTAYDDGGISGGTMERPALQRLLEDVRMNKIDVVVVYKVDRLTRSLADFAKMVEIFDAQSVSFVSVTQQFNTTTSMGRLTLNVLLSFAQFEREVTGERIRDKIAASKKKGMWMGGPVPLGYEVKERKLLVITKDAEIVRHVYRRYLDLGCVRLLQKDMVDSGIRSAKGHAISRGSLYKMLSNPIYIGQIRHKGICHPGQHEAIIYQELWDQVQQHLAENRNGIKSHSRKTEPSPLTGKLFDASGERLVPVHANKKGRRYRYYISQSLTTATKGETQSGWRLPALEVDQIVAQAAIDILQVNESKDIPDTIDRFVERVELHPEGLKLTLSLASLFSSKDTPSKITRNIPMQIKRRGVEMRLVIGNHAPARIDARLVKALRRAHQWFGELTSGQVKTLKDIVDREGIDKSYISRTMMLAFLAPDITEAILAGRQPVDLTIERLIKHTDLPLEWEAQRRLLGFI
jgi:site-specific DNA recombinase